MIQAELFVLFVSLRVHSLGICLDNLGEQSDADGMSQSVLHGVVVCCFCLGSGNFSGIKLSIDPWVLQCLHSCIPIQWRWVTEPQEEVDRVLGEMLRESPLRIFQSVDEVLFTVIFVVVEKQWVLSKTQKLVHYDAACPHVDLLAVELAWTSLLRSHVLECTCCILEPVCLAQADLELSCEPKISQFDLDVAAIIGQFTIESLNQNIGRFQIPVHEVLRVNLSHCINQLAHDLRHSQVVSGCISLICRARYLVEAIFQRTMRHVLHLNEAEFFTLVHLVESYNVWVAGPFVVPDRRWVAW